MRCGEPGRDQIWSTFYRRPVRTVSIYEAKTHLSRLVARAEAGEETLVTRHGRPVARLVPVGARTQRRSAGAWRGQVEMAEDFDELGAADEQDWYGA
jgi:prevent-host-death family protein